MLVAGDGPTLDHLCACPLLYTLVWAPLLKLLDNCLSQKGLLEARQLKMASEVIMSGGVGRCLSLLDSVLELIM